MKYLDKKFAVGGYSKEFSDNYDRVFGKKGEKPAEEAKPDMTDEEYDALERALGKAPGGEEQN